MLHATVPWPKQLDSLFKRGHMQPEKRQPDDDSLAQLARRLAFLRLLVPSNNCTRDEHPGAPVVVAAQP